jgi:hypothetical protein
MVLQEATMVGGARTEFEDFVETYGEGLLDVRPVVGRQPRHHAIALLPVVHRQAEDAHQRRVEVAGVEGDRRAVRKLQVGDGTAGLVGR